MDGIDGMVNGTVGVAAFSGHWNWFGLGTMSSTLTVHTLREGKRFNCMLILHVCF